MTIKIKYLFLSFLILGIIANSDYAYSQDSKPVKVYEDEEDIENQEPNKGDMEKTFDSITFKGQEFKSASYENMSRMYWYFGLPSIDNPEDLKVYFQINECELYQKYYGNEFEWGPLQETLADYLDKNRRSFSKKFYFVLPLNVGLYNIENKNFPVENDNYKGGRQFFPNPAYMGWKNEYCGWRRNNSAARSYPIDIVFQFIRPLSIPHVKIDEDKAKELVEKWQKPSYYGKRSLVLRLYTTITKFTGMKKFKRHEVAQFLVHVDGFEIYEDYTNSEILYTKSYRKKKKKSVSKKSENLENQEAPKIQQPVM